MDQTTLTNLAEQYANEQQNGSNFLDIKRAVLYRAVAMREDMQADLTAMQRKNEELEARCESLKKELRMRLKETRALDTILSEEYRRKLDNRIKELEQ